MESRALIPPIYLELSRKHGKMAHNIPRVNRKVSSGTLAWRISEALLHFNEKPRSTRMISWTNRSLFSLGLYRSLIKKYIPKPWFISYKPLLVPLEVSYGRFNSDRPRHPCRSKALLLAAGWISTFDQVEVHLSKTSSTRRGPRVTKEAIHPTGLPLVWVGLRYLLSWVPIQVHCKIGQL